MNNKYVVLRGGSWVDHQAHARADARYFDPPDDRNALFGFRVIKQPLNTTHVMRGGAWNNLAQDCRSAFRRKAQPDIHSNYLGFRVIKQKKQERKA